MTELLRSPRFQAAGVRRKRNRTKDSQRAAPMSGVSGPPGRLRRLVLDVGARLTPDRTVRADCRCRKAFGELPENRDEVILDVRHLPMTGQIGRTLARMEELPSGGRLRHINTLVPWPLFAMLEAQGYRYRLIGRNDGDIHIVIWPLEDVEGSGVPAPSPS